MTAAIVGLVAGERAAENGQVGARIVFDSATPVLDVAGRAAVLGRVVREGTLGHGAGAPGSHKRKDVDGFIANRASISDAGARAQRLVAGKGAELDGRRRSIQ